MLLHLLLVAVDVGVLGLCVVDGGGGGKGGEGVLKSSLSLVSSFLCS